MSDSLHSSINERFVIIDLHHRRVVRLHKTMSNYTRAIFMYYTRHRSCLKIFILTCVHYHLLMSCCAMDYHVHGIAIDETHTNQQQITFVLTCQCQNSYLSKLFLIGSTSVCVAAHSIGLFMSSYRKKKWLEVNSIDCVLRNNQSIRHHEYTRVSHSSVLYKIFLSTLDEFIRELAETVRCHASI
jgi:hypothetical protein